MPTKSPAQHRLMMAVAHDPAFAKKVGIKQSVGKDFAAADDAAGITRHPTMPKAEQATRIARTRKADKRGSPANGLREARAPRTHAEFERLGNSQRKGRFT